MYEYNETVGDGRCQSLALTGRGDVVTPIDGNRQTEDADRKTSGRAFSRLARCNAIVQKHPSSEKSKKTFSMLAAARQQILRDGVL